MPYDGRQSRPFTAAEQAQFDAAAQRDWDDNWAPAFDAVVEDGSLEIARNREQTRSVLRRASDELVDMTVQTPWQRQHEQDTEIDVDDDNDESGPVTYLDQLRQQQPTSHWTSFTHDKDRMR